MSKEKLTTSQERKLKFAEGGILVTLVLALAIFVGVRLSGENPQSPEMSEVNSSAVTAVVETVGMTEPVPDTFAPVTDQIEENEEMSVQVAEDTTAAEQAAEPAPEISSEPVTYAAAEQAFLSGDYEEAAAMFSRYTGTHPENAWGFYMLGLAEWKAGDGDGAEDAFLHALDLKPDHLKSLVNYARVLLELERPDEALTQVEMALAVNPNSLEAVRVQGRVQHNLGELQAAAASYRTVLAVQEDDVWSLNNLGLLLIEQERFAEALAPLAKASLLREDVACIQNNLGIALERCGHFGAAGEAYARAVAADPGHERAAASQDRVAQQIESPELAPVDLAELAAGFSARPGVMEMEVDMEVASAVEVSETADDKPETDGSRNR